MTGRAEAEARPWMLWILLGSGIFAGSFWLMLGFLSVLGQGASWLRLLQAMAPGGAVLLLVLNARHAPLPFGSALVGLGLLPFCFWPSQFSVWLRLAFGLPLLLLGAGFMLRQGRPYRHPDVR